MLSVLSLLGLVSFLKRIFLLLDCFCRDSMAMPRVLSFWAGLYVSSLLLASFCWSKGPLIYTSCILSFFGQYTAL